MRPRAAFATVTLVLCLAGCGAAKVSAGAGGSAASASSYREAADTACRTERGAMVALAARARRSHLDAAILVPLVEAINTRFVKAVEGLRPPSALAAARTRWLADMSALGPNKAVTVTGPAAAAQLESRARVRLRRVVADERALGLAACARIASEPEPRIPG